MSNFIIYFLPPCGFIVPVTSHRRTWRLLVPQCYCLCGDQAWSYPETLRRIQREGRGIRLHLLPQRRVGRRRSRWVRLMKLSPSILPNQITYTTHFIANYSQKSRSGRPYLTMFVYFIRLSHRPTDSGWASTHNIGTRQIPRWPWRIRACRANGRKDSSLRTFCSGERDLGVSSCIPSPLLCVYLLQNMTRMHNLLGLS